MIAFYKKAFDNLPVGVVSRKKFEGISKIYNFIGLFDFCLSERHATVEFFVTNPSLKIPEPSI